jgi:hypothetical protein
MAYSESQPEVSHIAATTFARADLHKFVQFKSSTRSPAEVQVVATTGIGDLAGTLLSVTATTSGAGVETVTVGLLQGIGKVYMAGSTRDSGQTISASSLGFGIAPTTNSAQLGHIIDASSGSTGRIASVQFGQSFNL